MLKIGGHYLDSNAADYFRMMPDGVCARRPLSATRRWRPRWHRDPPIRADVISKTLIHLMERPPGRTSRHIERLLRRPRSYAASMAWRLMRV